MNTTMTIDTKQIRFVLKNQNHSVELFCNHIYKEKYYTPFPSTPCDIKSAQNNSAHHFASTPCNIDNLTNNYMFCPNIL